MQICHVSQENSCIKVPSGGGGKKMKMKIEICIPLYSMKYKLSEYTQFMGNW